MKKREKVSEFFRKIKESLMGEAEVNYINGSESLPPPLSAEEEAEIIEEIRYSDSARAKLVEHNLRLVVYIAKKFENVESDIEDLISIGTIGLIKAVNTYRSDKNIKLATYASRCIENEILMYIRKNAGKKCEVSIDEPLSNDFDGNELLLSDVLGSDEEQIYRDIEAYEEKKTIREALQNLSKRERKIIIISQSYISRLEKKIISRLKSEIASKI